jgi:hypothetical protein
MGGTEVDDATWVDGEIRQFEGYGYRKEGAIAVFVG